MDGGNHEKKVDGEKKARKRDGGKFSLLRKRDGPQYSDLFLKKILSITPHERGLIILLEAILSRWRLRQQYYLDKALRIKVLSNLLPFFILTCNS